MVQDDLYQSSRAATSAAWEAPTPVPDVNTSANEEAPWVSADGSLLLFASDRSGDYEIYLTALR